jgi:putative transcriptional regulator
MAKRGKRNLFKELVAGFRELADEREGKITLRRYKLSHPSPPPAPKLAAREIVQIRESLRLSRPVFAQRLHINERTLERWEQGRSEPPPPVVALILLVRDYPDTLDRLEALEE